MNESISYTNVIMEMLLIIGPLSSSTLHKPTAETIFFIPEPKQNQTSQHRLYIYTYIFDTYVYTYIYIWPIYVNGYN